MFAHGILHSLGPGIFVALFTLIPALAVVIPERMAGR